MPDVGTRVSPALHPDTVRAVEGYNDTTAPFIDDVVSAFNDAYMTLESIHGASDAAKRNPSWTEEHRVLIVSKEAQKHQDRLLRRMDGAARSLGAAITHTERELARPLTEKAALGTLNQEIRSFVRGLKREERTKLLNEAMDGDDGDTLAAILGGKPFLSGLSPPEHANYVHRYNVKQNPGLVARLAVMRGAMDKLDRDGGKVLAEMQKAVGARPQEVNAIAQANERALNALKIEPQA